MSDSTDPGNRPAGESASPDARVAGRPSAVADAEFALLLTHDVDRPYKSVQSLYHAVRHGDPRQLKGLLPGVNPWWQFDEILDLEASLGVRSSFYFLQEPHLLARDPRDWLDPFYWVEHAGRYDVEAPEMVDLFDRLRTGGWEVGLHGSYDAYDDPDRLRTEKATLEAALGESVVGGRQHHLNRGPETWDHHREIGLRYDATPGSASEWGFHDGYLPRRPFDDEFVVFPLTLMEAALPDPGDAFGAAWRICEDLLVEAADNDAVMSVLWHPRVFAERDFPGYRRLYRRLIARALELGAWVGPPADYYELMDHPGGADAGSPSDPASAGGSGHGFDERDTGTRDRSPVPPVQAKDNKVSPGANTEPPE